MQEHQLTEILLNHSKKKKKEKKKGIKKLRENKLGGEKGGEVKQRMEKNEV